VRHTVFFNGTLAEIPPSACWPARELGIEIAFTREGRSGTRIIRMSASTPKQSSKAVSSVSTVSTVSNAGPTK
jgi:hypothetical protein